MPVRFSRLRIAGFKSFAEPATVEIFPGLTGIVGPNGCGKSNVVDALRWAMGEASARNLRGGDMDDVIFAGTVGRPSRNIAEVALILDEAAGVAPPPFHEQPELEITRRIERGTGSAFRVNGREVRARDVQTLFADLASGARTSAIVSQGRIGALVASRPEERRAVLEEAAGITGLHARRHEAELKLRAAEANLARAEDLRGQLETQLAGLKRQVRQASRYRNLSGAIRQAEAEHLSIQQARAETARTAAHAALLSSRQAVDAAGIEVAAANEQATRLANGLAPLRTAESDSRTVLERCRMAQEQVAAAEGRAKIALADAERRLAQLRNDLAHAEQLSRDAAIAEARLAQEDAALAEAGQTFPARTEAAEQAALQAADAAREAEAAANRATETAAAAAARVQAATQELAAAEQRARRLSGQHAAILQERDRVRLQAIDPARLAAGVAERDTAAASLAELRTQLELAEQHHAAAQSALADARTRQSAADSLRARLAAETRALADVLAVKDDEQWPPMVDALAVPPGLEAALGAALGEELTSAADPAAARHWRDLPAFDPPPALPAGAEPLGSLVGAPAALGRALSQIGLVPDESTGDAAQSRLAPGQCVVSRDGAVWRWDGYTIRAGTPTAAAVRLRQRNRLSALRAELADAETTAAAATAARAQAESAERTAATAGQQARTARRDAETRLDRARTAAAQLEAQAATAAARLAAVEQQLARLEPDRAEADAALERARTGHAALPDPATLRTAMEQARTILVQARDAETQARAELEALRRDQQAAAARRQAIAAERDAWQQRATDATHRVADLTTRGQHAAAEHASLAAIPAQAAEQRQQAASDLEAAQAAHRRAAAELAEAVKLSAEADRAARSADAALAVAREALVRAEGIATQADHAWGTIAEHILQRLGDATALPPLSADLTPETEEKARKRHERLLKEREEMGPVNLRAELEAAEIEQQIAAIEREREEIGTAVARLRGSIGHLNREGRERLTATFEQVDRHFQALFTRMFGGGRAHLALVGSDDPLEAGLELYAQPPGKKLSSLSLLSGGEQALTALSLIFAVFRCNPAPVCVLDEVDAPLDDVNVDRFCHLLEDVSRETETRFMVVTHHPLTMARMDRLYGVTMQERGVSRLLSVDLTTATEMAEPARMAAE
ncbi:MAG TPA: AAA family ATPase [Acetobacteraceae bacterium]